MFNHELLASMLDKKGIRQAAFARMTNIPRNLICRYLSGAVQPKADKIKAIADALGVTVDSFIVTEAKAPAPKLKLCFCPNCGVNLEGVVK